MVTTIQALAAEYSNGYADAAAKVHSISFLFIIYSASLICETPYFRISVGVLSQ
jgi:hypothetical protein